MKTTQNSYKDTIYKVRDGLWASQIYLETTIPNKKNIKTFYGSTRLEVKHKLDEFKTNYKITGTIVKVKNRNKKTTVNQIIC